MNARARQIPYKPNTQYLTCCNRNSENMSDVNNTPRPSPARRYSNRSLRRNGAGNSRSTSAGTKKIPLSGPVVISVNRANRKSPGDKNDRTKPGSGGGMNNPAPTDGPNPSA